MLPMKTRVLLAALLVCGCFDASAQVARRHLGRVSLSALPEKTYSIGYELRFGRKAGLDLSGSFGTHGALPDGVFNGNLLVHYFLESSESHSITYGNLVDKKDWAYISADRPLPDLPAFVPVQTLDFQLGYKFSFQKDSSRWRLFVQPGVGFGRHRFFEVLDSKHLERDIFRQETSGSYPNQIETWTHTIAYRQTRTMREQEKWVGGLRYDIGLTWFAGRNFFVESRVSGGLNNAAPHKGTVPRRFQHFFVSYSIDAGIQFGKVFKPKVRVWL